jgi:hypothetical protein
VHLTFVNVYEISRISDTNFGVFAKLRCTREIPLFFICYDSTALSATPTGFSEPFLKAFSKFDRAICVVCEPGDIPLQNFSPQQQDLVAAIVQWIEKVITENY